MQSAVLKHVDLNLSLPVPLQKQVKESEYGTDVHTVRAEYERHQKEHKVIDQFQGNVEKCREAEVRFHGEELKIYGERMTILQKVGSGSPQVTNKSIPTVVQRPEAGK